MAAGLSRRWKQTLCYHLTGETFDSKVMAKPLLDIIKKKCHGIGLFVKVVGSDNQGVVREMGVKVRRTSEPIVSYISHPESQNEKLYFTYDVPHLLKNTRNVFTNGCEILLSDVLVDKYALPSNTVKFEHILSLWQHDMNNPRGMKLAPNLTEKDLFPSHFDKMNVNLAKHFFDKSVSAGILYLIDLGLLPEEAKSTAWLVHQVNRCFFIMSNRKCALKSNYNCFKYHETITF